MGQGMMLGKQIVGNRWICCKAWTVVLAHDQRHKQELEAELQCWTNLFPGVKCISHNSCRYRNYDSCLLFRFCFRNLCNYSV